MVITIRCKACGHEGRVRGELQGRRVRCGCGTINLVEGPSSETGRLPPVERRSGFHRRIQPGIAPGPERRSPGDRRSGHGTGRRVAATQRPRLALLWACCSGAVLLVAAGLWFLLGPEGDPALPSPQAETLATGPGTDEATPRAGEERPRVAVDAGIELRPVASPPVASTPTVPEPPQETGPAVPQRPTKDARDLISENLLKWLDQARWLTVEKRWEEAVVVLDEIGEVSEAEMIEGPLVEEMFALRQRCEQGMAATRAEAQRLASERAARIERRERIEEERQAHRDRRAKEMVEIEQEVTKRTERWFNGRSYKNLLCRTCDGLELVTCKSCKGKGQRTVRSVGMGGSGERIEACGPCGGKGRRECPACVHGFRSDSLRSLFWGYLSPSARRDRKSTEVCADIVRGISLAREIGPELLVESARITRIQVLPREVRVMVRVVWDSRLWENRRQDELLRHQWEKDRRLAANPEDGDFILRWIREKNRYYVASDWGDEGEPLLEEPEPERGRVSEVAHLIDDLLNRAPRDPVGSALDAWQVWWAEYARARATWVGATIEDTGVVTQVFRDGGRVTRVQLQVGFYEVFVLPGGASLAAHGGTPDDTPWPKTLDQGQRIDLKGVIVSWSPDPGGSGQSAAPGVYRSPGHYGVPNTIDPMGSIGLVLTVAGSVRD